MKTVSRHLLGILALLVSLATFETMAQGIDGQWILVKRKLPDGTVLIPPAVLGQFSVHNGVNQIVVFWPAPNGTYGSISAINKWEWTESQVTVTPVLHIFDDGSGKPAVYTVGGTPKSSPLTRRGTAVSFQHPIDPPFNVWDGDKLTATLDGVFEDYWERAR